MIEYIKNNMANQETGGIATGCVGVSQKNDGHPYPLRRKGEKLRIELEEIYTPLSIAKKEIWKRWNDKELKKKVVKYLNGNIPDFLTHEPRAYIARHVASPNFDFLRFLDLAKDINLSPISPEFLDDKFICRNSAKYYLGKLFFFKRTKKTCAFNLDTKRIIDFQTEEGKKLKDIKTIENENFVDFHHKLFSHLNIDINGMTPDFSTWILERGKTPTEFYKFLLSLFICHGVMFENFLLNDEEMDFTNKIVLSTIRQLEKEFGVKPLIVPLLPFEEENKKYWFYYPENLKNYLKN